MRHVQLEFILIHFAARSATEASATIGQLAAIASAAEATMEQLLGILVVLHHGAHPTTRPFDRPALVNRIQEQLPDAQIIHGRAPGSCGEFGGEQQLFHGVTFLGSHFAIARVLELPPGTAEDFSA